MLRQLLRTVRNMLSPGGASRVVVPPQGQPDATAGLEKAEEPVGRVDLDPAARGQRPRVRDDRPPTRRPRVPPASSAARGSPGSRSTWHPSQFSVEPSEGKMRFHDLGLPADIMHGIHDLGFQYCTPIQAAILPKALEGVDVTGKAQTGTGKTAAFLVTIFAILERRAVVGKRAPGTPRALILVPTRELALQVKNDAGLLGKYCRSRVLAVFGGMDYQKQRQLLAEKVVDVLVATPGRLLDYKRQGEVHLGEVEVLVIDEADEMLNMGFIPDVRQIVHSTPPKGQRQTMLFGATLTEQVTRLASQWTRDPLTVEINPAQVAVESVEQMVYLVRARERFAVLYNMIVHQDLKRVIVFCNRRDQTRRLTDRLRAHGISCAALSGEVSQKKRIKTLEEFRSGIIRVMVATDVAGRGIHVEDISHVVNYNLPLDPEDYVHRIGRTGRAGALGVSVSFATEDEAFQIPAIEQYIGQPLHCVYPDDVLLAPVPIPPRHDPSAGRSPTAPSGGPAGTG